MTDDDHPGPARGPVLGISPEPGPEVTGLAPNRVGFAHHGEMGAEHDPVPGDHRPDRQRLEQSSVASHG